MEQRSVLKHWLTGLLIVVTFTGVLCAQAQNSFSIQYGAGAGYTFLEGENTPATAEFGKSLLFVQGFQAGYHINLNHSWSFITGVGIQVFGQRFFMDADNWRPPDGINLGDPFIPRFDASYTYRDYYLSVPLMIRYKLLNRRDHVLDLRSGVHGLVKLWQSTTNTLYGPDGKDVSRDFEGQERLNLAVSLPLKLVYSYRLSRELYLFGGPQLDMLFHLNNTANFWWREYPVRAMITVGLEF